MPLELNLRHLDAHNLRLQGELPVKELDLDLRDEMVRAGQPLAYDFEAQKLEGSLLLQGRLCLALECQCVRCLKPFQQELRLEKWTCHLPLQGEEKAVVVNDCVDLTPCIREDILLAFPQHPLCDTECRGLPKSCLGRAKKPSGASQARQAASAWDELNKLKL